MKNRHQFILGLAVLLGTLGLAVWQYSVMQANGVMAKSLQSQSSNLAVEKSVLIEEYQSIKNEVASERDSSAQEMSLVFPISEDLTKLTRLFDDFATKNNFNSNPFFISNISYRTAEMGEDQSYLYVPVNMQIITSKKNLNKFLEFIESSGSLESKVRLMSLEDMIVNYPQEYGGTYSVSLDLYAYFEAL